MKDMLLKFLNPYGATGHEEPIAQVIRETARPLVDEVETDALGNVICVKKGRAGARRIMVSAHMDHIGFVVTGADEKGFLRVHNVGGIRKRNSLNRHVVFENGVHGVLSNETEDFSADDNKMTNLFIDIGAANREQALAAVEIGDVAVYAPDVFELQNGLLVSPAMDDRAGCAVAMKALEMLGDCENEVAFVFSTQEEVGLRGAKAAAYGIDPQIGVALDVTPAGDTPKGDKLCVEVGKGPCIKILDRGSISSPKVVRGMEAAAERLGIAAQREVLTAGATDAGAIQTTRGGVYVGTISVACRYVHSACETISVEDCENAARLLAEFLRDPGF